MASPRELPPLIGQSPAFLQVLEEASCIAPLDRPVLVIGERGTGKELIASRIHYLSGRWEDPLVKLNCAALPETLLETELFGHEAGAFTGAVRRRAGRFEQADGGSLFLDEIAAAPMTVQEKILRVVEYGTFERVGSSATLACDVRVIAATNVDLPSEAEAGRFRYDLLDRLAFDVLTVPPLRARRDDVPVLADHFARAMAAELGRPLFPGFTAAVIEELTAYEWPGNVRELKNVVERAVYRWPDEARAVAAVQFDPFDSPYRPGPAKDSPAEIPAPERQPVATDDFEEAVAGFETTLLESALAEAHYNQRVAASSLNLGYHQFRNRLRKRGLLKKSAAGG